MIDSSIFFHVSQVSQISDRPYYLPVILGRLVCHSSRIPLGNGRYRVIYEVTLPPWLHTNLRSLSPRKIPSEQLFFLALRSRGTDRALRHIHPASLLEIIPRPHGVVFTNLSRPLSIGYRLIELHHERTSTGTIESHNGLKTWNIEAWKQITKVATKMLNIGFANLRQPWPFRTKVGCAILHMLMCSILDSRYSQHHPRVPILYRLP